MVFYDVYQSVCQCGNMLFIWCVYSFAHRVMISQGDNMLLIWCACAILNVMYRFVKLMACHSNGDLWYINGQSV